MYYPIIYESFDYEEIEDTKIDFIDWKDKAKSVAVFKTQGDMESVGNGYYRVNKNYTL